MPSSVLDDKIPHSILFPHPTTVEPPTVELDLPIAICKGIRSTRIMIIKIKNKSF